MTPFEWFIVGCFTIYASMNKWTVLAGGELSKTLYTIGLILIIASIVYSCGLALQSFWELLSW